jgi:hypothetical protein
MADSRNVRSHFDAVGQARAGDFAESGVGFLRRLRINTYANTALFRTALQRRGLRFSPDLIASGTNQLCKRRHGSPSIELKFKSHSTSRNSATRRVSGVHTKKGLNRDPGQPTRNPHYYQQAEHFIWSERRGLLGFAGLAPHSGRSSHPDPSFFVPGRKTFPFTNRAKLP